MIAKVIGAIISIPLLFFIPGYALFRSRLFKEHRMQWLSKLFLVIAVSASATSLVALFLGEIGHLSIWLLDLILAAMAVLTRLIFGNVRRSLFSPRPVRWEIPVLVLLVLLSLVMFFRPFETILGDGDPGYYFNNGVHLARTGSISIIEKSVPEMSDSELAIFYENAIQQFMPFHLRVRQTGKIQPLLYHLLPVWIGTFIMLFGKWGGLFVNPLFALLSVLLVFAIARRFVGVVGAGAGALLLILFFPQVYFARTTASEIMAEFFLLAAILFFAEFLRNRGVATALASAGCATTASVARPEAMMIFLPMLAVMFFGMFRARYKVADYVFVNAALAGLVYVWVYILVAEYYYFSTNSGKVLALMKTHGGTTTFLTIMLWSIGFAFIFFNLCPLGHYFAGLGERMAKKLANRALLVSRVAKGTLATVTFAVFAYLYFIAPHRAANVVSPQKFFYHTTVFFGGVVIFVFVAGLCLLLFESDSLGFSFLVSSTVLILSVVFTESAVTAGYLPWLSRRYMTVMVPILFVGFGYLVGRLWESGFPALRVAAVFTTLCLMGLFSFYAAPLFNHVEYKGINRQIENLAKKLDGDVVIFTETFSGEAVGIPLRYQYDVDARRAWRLDDYAAIDQMVRKYTALGRKVIIETTGSGMLQFNEKLLDFLYFKKAFEVKVSFPRFRTTLTSRPQHAGTETHDLTFFYLVPKESQPPG